MSHNRIIKYQATPIDGDAVNQPIIGGCHRGVAGLSGDTTMYDVELRLHLDADSWHKLAEWLHMTMNAQGKRHEPRSVKPNALAALDGFDG